MGEVRQCEARLYIGDDFGDNSAGMRCQLAEGHAGSHREEWVAHRGGHVALTWEHDESEVCAKCGAHVDMCYGFGGTCGNCAPTCKTCGGTVLAYEATDEKCRLCNGDPAWREKARESRRRTPDA